jgi:hypothetical protein
MRDHAIGLLRVGRCRRLFPFLLAIPMSVAAPPAGAQDLFGFLRRLFQPSVGVPASPRYGAPHVPRRALRRQKVLRADPSPGKAPLTPRPMGEVTNPVPMLLTDGTLRRGDIVMFPDGPRVFVGQAGSQHQLGDFEPITANSKNVPQGTRKLLAHLRPGWNGAWAADAPAVSEQIAAVKDVHSTGSVRRRRR